MTAAAAAGDPPMPMSPKQLQSIREAAARVNLWVGAIRSGKTVASLLRFLIAVALAGGGGEIVITGRTRDSVFRNVLGPLMDPDLWGPVARHVSYTQGAPTATILGRTVHVIGASDAKAEMIVRGMTVLIWYGDELTVHPEAFVAQMLGRMSPPGAQAFLTTNPEGPRHWAKIKYLDRAAALGWVWWHFTLDDNPSLDAKYVESIKRELTGVWYLRYIAGEWATAEGAIYDTFTAATHVGPLPEGVTILARVVGVDYGTTNATAAVMLGLGTDRRAYVLAEWRHDSRAGQARWTDAQLSAGLRAWLDQHPPVEWVAVDPSAASFRLQLWADGIANVVEADNSVADGIRTVASLLSIGSLRIVDAPHLVDEIPGYVWDPKSAEKGVDAPVKVDDHSCDALRYACMIAAPLWGHRLEKGVAAGAAA